MNKVQVSICFNSVIIYDNSGISKSDQLEFNSRISRSVQLLESIILAKRFNSENLKD